MHSFPLLIALTINQVAHAAPLAHLYRNTIADSVIQRWSTVVLPVLPRDLVICIHIDGSVTPLLKGEDCDGKTRTGTLPSTVGTPGDDDNGLGLEIHLGDQGNERNPSTTSPAPGDDGDGDLFGGLGSGLLEHDNPLNSGTNSISPPFSGPNSVSNSNSPNGKDGDPTSGGGGQGSYTPGSVPVFAGQYGPGGEQPRNARGDDNGYHVHVGPNESEHGHRGSDGDNGHGGTDSDNHAQDIPDNGSDHVNSSDERGHEQAGYEGLAGDQGQNGYEGGDHGHTQSEGGGHGRDRHDEDEHGHDQSAGDHGRDVPALDTNADDCDEDSGGSRPWSSSNGPGPIQLPPKQSHKSRLHPQLWSPKPKPHLYAQKHHHGPQDQKDKPYYAQPSYRLPSHFRSSSSPQRESLTWTETEPECVEQ